MTNPKISPEQMAANITRAADSGTLAQTPNGRKWEKVLENVPLSPATETEVAEELSK